MSTSSVRSLDQGLGLECSEGRASATQVRLRSAATLVSLPQSALASRAQIVLEPELMELASAGLALAVPPHRRNLRRGAGGWSLLRFAGLTS
ncbi:MAG TPA: hypothetical protein EYM27_05440 [Dehalococcoidia bacterium]|nr:hypothetical protein [Dehalococcoidia bacterium]